VTGAIRTAGLEKRYGDVGVLGVHLAVPSGCVYGLVGPNGAGKSTLLGLLAGVRHPTAGTIDIAVDRRRIAVAADVPAFEPWLTAREVLILARRLVCGDEAPERVEQLLGESGLAEAAERRCGGFSRGMTQRLGLAVAMVGEPDLLLLDEPSSALDPAGRAEVLDLISRLRGRATVLFSTHILSDVQRVCDTVGILVRGRLAYQGPLDRLLAEHLTATWNVRVRGDADAVAAALRTEPWVRRAELGAPGQVVVEATSLDAGEVRLVAALAALDVPVIAVEPAEGDLEDAFLAVTADGTLAP
jgi:ABC-2 type transport system ATP-binding protein